MKNLRNPWSIDNLVDALKRTNPARWEHNGDKGDTQYWYHLPTGEVIGLSPSSQPNEYQLSVYSSPISLVGRGQHSFESPHSNPGFDSRYESVNKRIWLEYWKVKSPDGSPLRQLYQKIIEHEDKENTRRLTKTVQKSIADIKRWTARQKG